MNNPDKSTVETPSGKDADYENFPVGSFLLPAHLRPHIAAYYHFARAIDDVADNPDISADIKIERLSGFEDAINGHNCEDPAFVTGHRARISLLETGVSSQHYLDLIAAFKQDAVKNRYDSWEDLVDYCLLSAAPVGRYLIDLNGGSVDGYGPSDALCIALQVINHLQDCQDDFHSLDRVYLPAEWMTASGAMVDDLNSSASSSGLRTVLDQCLEATERMMEKARPLPSGVSSRRLAMESQAIINIADRLIVKLRFGDPLERRIKLSKPEYVWCCATGAISAVIQGKRQ
jgi:squalene synthase HpnC